MTLPAAPHPRWLEGRIREALDDTPVVAMEGPRQAGKSTLMHAIIDGQPGWTSWTLDDLNVLERAHADPAGLIAAAPGPVAIGEVQRAPQLLLAIKASVDRDRRPGRFPPATERRSAHRRRAWFDAYLATSLQRDVRDVAGIARLSDLTRLARLVAARTARPVNVSEMSRTSSLPTSTLARYHQALQALFLVEEVPAWATNAGKRLARRPKLLISDAGLGGALLGMTAARWASVDEARGPLTETFVALELRRQLGRSSVSATLHHYRDHDGAEVDLLLEADDGRIVGVEVRSGHRLGLDATRHLAGLRLAVGDRFARGVVLHGGDTAAPLDDRTWALPISALWTTR